MKPTPEELARALADGPLAPLTGPLVAAVADIDRLAGEMGTAQLDPRLFSPGAEAFLWDDVLSLQDAAAVAKAVFTGFGLKESAELLLKMALFWRKVRGVRVPLTEAEYQVMKAVKKAPATAAEVAARIGRPPAEVAAVVSTLKGRKYREGVMLLDEGAGGVLSTQF